MANTFYYDACNVDTKATPFPNSVKSIQLDEGLQFNTSADDNEQLLLPHSIMNEHVAINYRNICNFYPLMSQTSNFTEYSDYERCMMNDEFIAAYLRDKKNPTYKNIISYYNNDEFDPYGLAKYRMQDFIYLKYYNQIPNNYMITLRRYTKPCEDHMFGLDMSPDMINSMNNYPDSYSALATAVTYMGEKTGNKLSDILKFDYGANWEEREGKVESMKNPDGGLAAQMRKMGIQDDLLNATASLGGNNSITSQLRSLIKFSAMSFGKGVDVNKALSSQYDYDGNTFDMRYGESLYGDVNVINKIKLRSRGLTFSNNMTLNFEYSLKSLKCVNPRIAMMDILSNFLILTGNYGEFWGGATIFYGNRNIAPQYGDPKLLRQGKYGEYLKSLAGDVKEGFQKISEMESMNSFGDITSGLWNSLKNITSGFAQSLLGNLLGGNIGIAGEAQAVPALLSGAPSGFWHLTVGNPLDPIAMMGNMAVTKTTVQFGDALGYDDFPTEIKFTVELEHCRPRDNAGIENMFNAGKGRFYTFTTSGILDAYHNIDIYNNFQVDKDNYNIETERNTTFDSYGKPIESPSEHNKIDGLNIIKTIGGFLNG